MLQLDVELEAIERVVIKIEQANNDSSYEPSTGRKFMLLAFPGTLSSWIDASLFAKRHRRLSLFWCIYKMFFSIHQNF